MLDALAHLFSYVVQPCYDLTGSWWLAILLFTVIIKIVLLPLSLWCQWNSIVMVRLMPDLNRGSKVGTSATRKPSERSRTSSTKSTTTIRCSRSFRWRSGAHPLWPCRGHPRHHDGGAPGTEFLGMVPAEDGGLSWIMPFLAALSAVIMGEAQNRINPLQREQSRLEKNSTNGLSVLLSLVLGIYVALRHGLYRICSNLMSIAVQRSATSSSNRRSTWTIRTSRPQKMSLRG